MEYKIFKHKVNIDGSNLISYGIFVTNDNKVIERYYDISFDKESVEKLVRDLNEYEVSIVHFKDVIDDFLAL